MNGDYFKEGYSLMMNYMRNEKILTKERNFRRRLDNFYNKHKDDDLLDIEAELEYLRLEKYFFNNILDEPSNKSDKASVEFLNILASIDKVERFEEK